MGDLRSPSAPMAKGRETTKAAPHWFVYGKGARGRRIDVPKKGLPSAAFGTTIAFTNPLATKCFGSRCAVMLLN